jgi:vacuolar-type H+-ATPase subunit H
MSDQSTRDKNKDMLRQGFEPAGTSGAGATEDPSGSTAADANGSIGATIEQARQIAGDTMEQARSTARNLAEQARSAIADPGATAQELARRAREQAATASDVIYQQGTRAGEYLSRNVNEYPLAALLIAGAVGYGLAYLIHARWQD